jgi:hypothetical protein
MEVDT